MLSKPNECNGCPFQSIGIGYVPPIGEGHVALMGMAPAEDEVKQGKPFVGRAGKLLNKIMWHGGLNRDNYVILNVIQCQPPSYDVISHPAAWDAINHCGCQRKKALSRVTTIIALGNLPFELLTGESGVGSKRGYVYHTPSYHVIPSLHPAGLLRDEGERGIGKVPAILYDIKYGPIKANRPYDKPNLLLDPYLGEWESYVGKAINAEWVVCDIETEKSSGKKEDELDDPSYDILRIGFSLPDYRSCSISFGMPYLDGIKAILRTASIKIYHNYRFDVPRLHFNGIQTGGDFRDTMWLWHFYHPDLPKDLGHIATYYTNLMEWKSKSSDFARYNALDCYATARVYMGVKQDLESRGMWKDALFYTTEVLRVLDKIHSRGVRIDTDRLDAFKRKVEDELTLLQGQINSQIGEECRKYHPPNGYKKTPKDTTGLVLRDFKDDKGCTVQRWCKIKDFLPTSSGQVQAYLETKSVELPKAKKKKGGVTTERKFLKRMVEQDSNISLFLRFRELKKMTTYTQWTIHQDGKAHPIYGLSPATGRISCSSPNFQTIPKEGELANNFRECIVASPSHKLLSYDVSGFEAILTGYFADDKDFMDLATKGIYSFVLARYKGINLNPKDPDLIPKLNQVKQDNITLYKKFKQAVLGTLYRMGPKKLFEENPGTFEDKDEARIIQNSFLKLFPRIKVWRRRMEETAKRQSYLMTPFKHIRWFWDVPGSDTPKTAAQLPQSSAAAIMKQNMIYLNRTIASSYMVGMIHDELVFDVPDAMVDGIRQIVEEIMGRAIPELGGLRFNVVGKVGDHL